MNRFLKNCSLPPLHAPHNISVNHKKKCATNTTMSFCAPNYFLFDLF